MSYAIDRSAPASGHFRSYLALPGISGRSFLPVSFLGRMPATMAPLAVLTFTAVNSGSYATAGLAATATAVGTAVGAPVMGRLADRRGQRPVLVVAVVLNALALTLLALGAGPTAGPGGGRVLLLALCGLVGLTLPQVGGMARARWLALTRSHAGTAMAYEGTADEIAYVVGPALAGVLASFWGPSAALLAAAGAGLIGAGAFALHPTHAVRAPAADETTGVEPGPGLLRLILAPVLAMVLMGAFFGAVQSALTVYAATIGRPTAAGLIYALMAVGSAVTALATAVVPDRIGPARRAAGSAALLLTGVLLILIGISSSLGVLVGAVLFTGLGVGPMLVTLNQVVGARVPVRRSATAMSYLSAGGVIGIAAGAAGAGLLADLAGTAGPLGVAGAASVLLLFVTGVGLRP